MKTLFVAPQVPWPLDVGSKIRVNNLLRCYAELGAVTLVCFAQDPSEAESISGVDCYCHRVYLLPLNAGEAGAASQVGRIGVLGQVMHAQPRLVRYFSSQELAGRVASLVNGEDFDILHVERLAMAQYADCALRTPSGARRPYLMLDLDDLESEKMRRMAALEPWGSPQKYLRLLECLKLFVYERGVVRQFDCVLACSEHDRRRLQHGPRSPRVEVFCNGAEAESSAVLDEQRDAGCTLVLFGAMNYQPNEDAALYFAESVLPLVRREVPDVRFIVAGKSPSARVRALENGRDVLVTGYVQDKTALFNSCTVFIVPLRIGGGTRIKILEAMAAAKPVVSTTIGCEGIDVSPGENILIANSPEEFAGACRDLLLNAAQRQAVGRAGRDLVLRRYRWGEIRKGYIKTLEDCFRRPGV